MSPTHLHLLLNHVPIFGTAFGLILLAVALRRNSEELKKIALGVFVIIALLAIPVYLTGEPAEDLVKPLPGVSKAIIEQHEEAAAIAFTAVVALGVACLAGLLLFRKGTAVPGWFAGTLLAAALIVTGMMAWTANLGGQVRHTEIRSASASADARVRDH